MEEQVTNANVMEKAEILQMLQDADVRAAILRIVREGNAVAESSLHNEMTDAARQSTELEMERLREDLAQEKNRCNELQKQNESLTMQLQEVTKDREIRIKSEEKLQGEKRVLTERLQEVEKLMREQKSVFRRLQEAQKEAEQQNSSLLTEKERLQSNYEAAKREHAQEKQRLAYDLASEQGERQRLEQCKTALEKASQALQRQLDERFARGWELFEQYRNVNEHTRQLLHNGVFTQEASFMSFICGGAQLTALDRLWDALRDCVLRKQQDDAKILWDIFEYCLELVNASRTQAKYEILSVKVGDSFDSDCHSEGPNSKAQGIVRKVYLQGYRNTYSDRIMKKSIVQVG